MDVYMYVYVCGYLIILEDRVVDQYVSDVYEMMMILDKCIRYVVG